MFLIFAIFLMGYQSKSVSLRENPFKKKREPEEKSQNLELIKKKTKKYSKKKQKEEEEGDLLKSEKMIFSMDNISRNSYKGLVYGEIEMEEQNEEKNLDNNFENEILEMEEKLNQMRREKVDKQKIFNENVFLIFRHGMRTPIMPKNLSKLARV